MTDDEILDRIIAREGRRYTEHAADQGGCSRYGITLETLRAWRHGAFEPTCADIRALTLAEARQIYRTRYLAPFDDLTDGATKEVLVDAAVHSGVGRATRWLQEALGVETDGIIGPQTRAALTGADLGALARAVVRLRLRFVARLITDDYATRCALIEARVAGTGVESDVRVLLAGGQARNCAGWIARIAAFV